MKRTYENALRLLDSQRRTARPKSPAAPSAHLASTTPSGIVTVKGLPSLAGMKEWLQALGHSEQDVDDLNIIHVAGTKGKGSTCAFTRSFLSAHGLRTGFPKRVGLYTSPHLQSIRERIQIDGEPIAENLFTRYFFEVWERLVSAESNQLTGIERKPRYLQLLALLAFHTFIKENVDAAVFETHHGGHYDTTNVIRKPIVTGITSLGMDHIAELGPTIKDIAWHKAGIFKPNVFAYSVMQDAGPSEVLRQCAAERNTELKFVSASSTLPSDRGALSVPVQRLNCSLALQMASSFVLLKNPGHILDEDDVSKGIDGFSWIGRFEVINKGTSQWFLDGAHNQLSLSQAAGWFSKNANGSSDVPKYRVLIFSHFSKARDGVPLVECLAQALSEFNAEPDHVIFTTYQEREDGSMRIDDIHKVLENPFPDLCSIYSSLWKDTHPNAAISTEPTIEGAIKLAERISAERDGMQAFVTGSLYLVGGALRILRP